MKFRTASQDCQAGESAVKSLSQGYNRMARVDFEPKTCRSQARRSTHLTTLQILFSNRNSNFYLFNNHNKSGLSCLDSSI